MRIILDSDDATDLAHCLMLARDMLSKGEEGDVWGYWAQRDPQFSALIRFNKASVSVRGRRNTPAAVMPTSPGDHPSHTDPAFSASSGTDTVGAEGISHG